MVYCKIQNGIVVDRAIFSGEMPSSWPDFSLWVQDNEAQIGWVLVDGDLVDPHAE